MYIFDFIKRITRKGNIPILIYFILNIFVIAGTIFVLNSESGMQFWQSFLLGIALYIISLAVALSPIGEMILRFQTGCKKIKRLEQKEFIEPIFAEIYNKSKEQNTLTPDGVQLFINDDKAPNAFATGRKTICITEGLLHMPVDQIKATLSHEFGHLAHKDTDLILAISVGNLIVNGIIICIKLIVDFFHLIFGVSAIFLGGSDGIVAAIINNINHFLLTAVVGGLTQLWTWLGTILVMKSSRANEFEADEFAYNLGYGNALCKLLDTIEKTEAKGLFATLASSHPSKDDRIARLQELGTEYRSISRV